MLFGINLILVFGLLNLALIVFQLLSGLRVIKVPMAVHRGTGILLCVCAVIHGAFAFLVS